MWIRDSIRQWQIKDPVRGDAVVVSCNNADWFQSRRVPVVVDRADPTRLRVDRRENDRRYKQRVKAARAETERVETAKAYGTYDVEKEAAAYDSELKELSKKEVQA